MVNDGSVDQDEDALEEEAEIEELFRCCDCGVDTLEIDEYYMVQFDLWERVVPEAWRQGMLCIGCLEKLLGRELTTEDFTECLANYDTQKSDRLLNRLGEWFRAFDGPYATSEEAAQAASEFNRRRGWEL